MLRESLVMIPGTLCDERIFAHQAKYLKRQCNVILVNYKGLRKIDSWADELLAKLPPNFSILGFSLGGIWALELLRIAPHRINKLALVASNAEAASRTSIHRSKEMWAQWKSRGPKNLIAHVSKNYFHYPQHLKQHNSLLEDMAQKTNTRAANSSFKWASCRSSSYHTISIFKKPVLLISGQKDNLCPNVMQKKIAQTNSLVTWIEIPRCGHFIPLEQPKKLTHLIQNWINLPPTKTET